MNKLAALILLCVALAFAQQNTPYTLQSFINDNNVLNYALSLENFEAELYRRAAASFSRTSFANAGYNASTYDYLGTLAAQEAVHASAINTTLLNRGWPPVQSCSYNFPSGVFTNVNTFLTFTATVEALGVSAYDGAVPYLSDPTLLQFAATVATVEGRHSAYLYRLTGQNFSPFAFEPATTPADVLKQVAGYLGNCPVSVLQTGYNGTVSVSSTTLTLPVLANVTRQLNSAFGTANAPVVTISSAARLNDDRVLNYALTALQFVDAFLNYSLTGMGQGPAPVTADTLSAAGYSPAVLTGLFTILTQNTAQVAAVRMVIASRGQTPVEPCIYTFNTVVTDVPTFWRLAVTFENVSVAAFDGGISAISDTSLAQTAATIATVEGRHSAFLNNASGAASPFPSPYDGTLTPTETRNLLSPYISSCPVKNVETGSGLTIDSTTLTLPTPLNYFGQANQMVNGQNNGGVLQINPAAGTPTSSTTSGNGNNGMGGAASLVASVALIAAAVAIAF